MATVTEHGCEETFGPDGQKVVRTFHVSPYSDRLAVIDALLGGVQYVGGAIRRIFPARDPAMTWLFAQTVNCTPIEDDPGTHLPGANVLTTRADYSTAVLRVEYSRLDNEETPADTSETETTEQQEIDLATVAMDFSARHLKLPNQWYVWSETVGGANDGAVFNSDIGVVKVYPGITLNITRPRVAKLPLEAILTNLGRINAAAFTIAGVTYPKESLRFDSARESRKITSRGYKFHELSYSFAVQPTYEKVLAAGDKDWVGWNRLFDPLKDRWRYVRTNVGGDTKYIYELDSAGKSQDINGVTRTGFNLLFHPRAR